MKLIMLFLGLCFLALCLLSGVWAVIFIPYFGAAAIIVLALIVCRGVRKGLRQRRNARPAP